MNLHLKTSLVIILIVSVVFLVCTFPIIIPITLGMFLFVLIYAGIYNSLSPDDDVPGW